MSLYLLLNIASISIPFGYSFERKMRFIRWWKPVFLAILIVAVPFVIWDVIFTARGIWGFNPSYLLGINIFGLPLEELLFFICIPYACIFTHYAFLYFFPNVKLSNSLTRVISICLILFAVMILYLSYPKAYTTWTFVLFIVLLGYSLLFKSLNLNRFYITFFIILIPFFIVNGILTGSFIENQVVWYNDSENLGIRLGTVPFEDLFYAFNLLYLNLIIVEKFKLKFTRWYAIN